VALLKRGRKYFGRALGCLKIVKTAAEGADALFYLTPRERIPGAIKKNG
jgi:hypothetical protein